QIALGHDPKRTDRRERSALVAVQLVAIVAVNDDLPFESSREFQSFDERIPRISITWVIGAFARVLKNVAVAVVRRAATELDPMRLDVAPIVDVTISRIVVKHRCTPTRNLQF